VAQVLWACAIFVGRDIGSFNRMRHPCVRGLKPALILDLRGAEAPLFHGRAGIPGCHGFVECPFSSRNTIKSKVKNKVKGQGQECPLYTGVNCACSHGADLEGANYGSAVWGL
jgi:hypothetical protein